MAKILVTGGAGFIGSHIVEELLARNYSVVVLDNLSTGKLENLPVNAPSLQIIVGSILDETAVSQAIKHCDTVIHLAAIASVQASVEAPMNTHSVNFDGTLVLLEGAKKAGVKRFIYASSAAVYGDTSQVSISESTPVSPLTPYAIDKLTSEFYIRYYRRSVGLDSTIFRFFNVYGPRQDPSSPYSGVISIFSTACLAGKPLTIFGDGQQTRDFIFVKDLASILADSIDNINTYGESINIGTGVSISLLKIASILGEVVDKPIKFEFREGRKGDIRHSLANVELLRSFYGEIKYTSIQNGLRLTVKHCI